LIRSPVAKESTSDSYGKMIRNLRSPVAGKVPRTSLKDNDKKNDKKMKRSPVA
jgi:hypothetical protein